MTSSFKKCNALQGELKYVLEASKPLFRDCHDDESHRVQLKLEIIFWNLLQKLFPVKLSYLNLMITLYNRKDEGRYMTVLVTFSTSFSYNKLRFL